LKTVNRGQLQKDTKSRSEACSTQDQQIGIARDGLVR
jgi:hypothetical protein